MAPPSGVPSTVADLAPEDQRGALLVVAHREGRLRSELGAPGDVERALDGALAAFAVSAGDLLDDVLDEDVEEQRPLAVLLRPGSATP